MIKNRKILLVSIMRDVNTRKRVHTSLLTIRKNYCYYNIIKKKCII